MDAPLLAQALVERYHLKGSRTGEGCQVGVAPDFGRKRPLLRLGPPLLFEASRFVGESDSGIAQHGIVLQPCFPERHGLLLECSGITCQSEEALLRPTTKTARVAGALVPGCGGRVMKVKVESQRKPDINVGEKHLASWARQRPTLSIARETPGDWQDPLLAEFPQSVH